MELESYAYYNYLHVPYKVAQEQQWWILQYHRQKKICDQWTVLLSTLYAVMIIIFNGSAFSLYAAPGHQWLNSHEVVLVYSQCTMDCNAEHPLFRDPHFCWISITPVWRSPTWMTQLTWGCTDSDKISWTITTISTTLSNIYIYQPFSWSEIYEGVVITKWLPVVIK